MKKYILFLIVILVFTSCRKRNGRFLFAGAWLIEKVEQVKYVDNVQTLDSTIQNDTLGWFALSNYLVEGYDIARFEVNYSTFSGLVSDDAGRWEIDEHEGDRLRINGATFTRVRIVGGEKWTWVSSPDAGITYTRETIFVKRK